MTRFASSRRGFRCQPGAVRCGSGYFIDFRSDAQVEIKESFTPLNSNGDGTDASTRSEGSSRSLLAPMMTIAGPFLGTVLDTDLFSAPVNTALDCGLVGGNTEWLEELMTALTQPVRDEQDRRLAALRTARPKELRARIREIERERKAFFGNNPVRNRNATASFDLKIRELQNGLSPAVIIENLPPGSLIKVASQSGGSLVALYSAMTVESLLDARTKGHFDLSFLADAWRGKHPRLDFSVKSR